KKFDVAEIEWTLKSTAANMGVKVGAIIHPTRLAVTGSNVGPSLYHLLEVLGKEKVIARIDRALSMFERGESVELALQPRFCIAGVYSRCRSCGPPARFVRITSSPLSP